MIPTFERAKTLYALDRGATVIGEEMRIQNKCFITRTTQHIVRVYPIKARKEYNI
jgi:hypothetical protein